MASASAATLLLLSLFYATIDASRPSPPFANSSVTSTRPNYHSSPSFTPSNVAHSSPVITPHITHPPNGSSRFQGACTVDVPNAGLNWWYNTTIDYPQVSLEYYYTTPHYNVTPYATGWTRLDNPTPTPVISDVFSETWYYQTTVTATNRAKNTTYIAHTWLDLVPPNAPATTTFGEIGYSTAIPYRSSFKSGKLFDYSSYLLPLPTPTTVLATGSAAYTGTYGTPFLRFSQYEVKGLVSTTKNGKPALVTATSTYNLTQTQGYGLAPYDFDGVVSASGTVPAAFSNVIAQSSCVMGTWHAVPTVIIVVVYDIKAFVYGTVVQSIITFSSVAATSGSAALASFNEPFRTYSTGALSKTGVPLAPLPLTMATSVAGAATAESLQLPDSDITYVTATAQCQGSNGCQIIIAGEGSGADATATSAASLQTPTWFPGPSRPTATSQAQSGSKSTPQPAAVAGASTTPTPTRHTANLPTNTNSDSSVSTEYDFGPLISLIGTLPHGQQPIITAVQTAHAVNAPHPPVLSANGQRYTANSNGAFVINGQTLTPGGAITVSGTTISLMPGASAIVIGGSTRVIAGAVTAAPGGLVVGAKTYTASPGTTYVVEGQTLTPGGVITVGGTRVSLNPAGTVAVVGSTTEFLTVPAMATTTGVGGYIISAIGGGGAAVVAPTSTTTTSSSSAVETGAAISRSSGLSLLASTCSFILLLLSATVVL